MLWVLFRYRETVPPASYYQIEVPLEDTPKLATVITADIGKLAQALPDHTLRFHRVSIEEAHDALEDQDSVLRAISRQGSPLSMTVSIGDVAYQVETPDGLPVTKTSLQTASTSETTRRLSAVIDGKSFDFKVDVTQEE